MWTDSSCDQDTRLTPGMHLLHHARRIIAHRRLPPGRRSKRIPFCGKSRQTSLQTCGAGNRLPNLPCPPRLIEFDRCGNPICRGGRCNTQPSSDKIAHKSRCLTAPPTSLTKLSIAGVVKKYEPVWVSHPVSSRRAGGPADTAADTYKTGSRSKLPARKKHPANPRSNKTVLSTDKPDPSSSDRICLDRFSSFRS